MNGVHEMALKFELETLDGLDDSVASLYQEHNGKYRLAVDGIDPADELKEALRKEREEKSNYKSKLSEFEKQQQETDRKRLEEKQEFESLYKSERESKSNLARELDELKTSIANEKRTNEAIKIAAEITSHKIKSELLQKEALQFIHSTPDGLKINGPDGEAWDAPRLVGYLEEKYPFLADGSNANGGGAVGGKNGGAMTKKAVDYTEKERIELFNQDPEKFKEIFNMR